MGFHGSDQQSHSQQPLARQNSWYGLTLHEVEGNLGRRLGSMNLDELLKNVWTAEANSHYAANAMNIDSKSASAAPASSLQLQASLALVRSFSGRTVDEVWREIKHGQKMRTFNQETEEGQDQKREPTLGETTLENFLVEAGLYVADASLGPTLVLDRVLSTPHSFTQRMGLSSSPSMEALSDASERGRKRYAHGDGIDKTLDRRLKRKIKNRESAARSRARKQAYHNELVSKVSRLEEENMKLKKEKAGTFFYHGHYGMQRSAGLYGALIVSETDRRREPFRYDGEFTLLLSDWWHQNVHRQEVDLLAKPIRFIGEPQSLLMNGRGQYNCSVAAHYDSSSTLCKENDQCAPQVIHVRPNKIYRIRVASTTALSSLNLMIGNHKLEVVEADGNYVKPFLVDDLDIYSGESYSVLLKTDQSSTENYWISIGVRGRHPMTPPALTILNYSPTPASKHPASKPPVHPRWDDYDHSKSFSNKVQAQMGYNKQPPNKYDRRILLLNTQNLIDGQTKWSINNVSLSLPNTPYLGAIKYGLDNAFNQQSPPDTYSDLHDIMKPPVNPNSTYGNGVYTLAYNTTIDVILQNANVLKHNTSEVHPWHLHGHDFWVLGYGEGKFTDADVTKFNLVNPPLRNTVVIYPFGWTALRFVTDNPGVWAFHCHIEPHLHMGMGVIFAEAVEHIKKMKVNKEALTCGLTAKMFMNSHN